MIESKIYEFLYEKRPFVPFTVFLSDGSSYRVPHVDFGFLPHSRRYFEVETEQGKPVTINLGQITRVEAETPASEVTAGGTGQRS